MIGEDVWADCGKELFRDGDWSLYIDYKIEYNPGGFPRPTTPKDRIIAIGHYCDGKEWRTVVNLGIGGNQCRNCEETVPAAMKGLQKLAEWER